MIKMLMFDVKKTEKIFLHRDEFSDFDINFFDESLCDETKLTIKEYNETAIISVFINSKIDKKVIDKFKNLRIIATRSICCNHIDIKECRRRNIAVINAVNYGSDSISQYVLGLILALTRKIFLSANDLKNSKNIYENYQSNDISNYTLGVIGTGKIGSEVCKLAHSLRMKIYANDIKINEDIKNFVEYVSFTDLLRKSDIVTLHIPYIKECKHMFTIKEFEIMKDNSYFINTSQGDFVDYISLYKVLSGGKLAGAGLDIIWENQNNIFNNILDNANYEELEKMIVCQKIMGMDNVIITPRIAYNTTESLNKILKSNFNDIRNFFKGMKTNRIV